MYAVDIDFAYDGPYDASSEAREIVMFERDYGVRSTLVGRANGWPVLHVESSDRKILEDLLEARDETWRAHEIDEIDPARGLAHENQDHPVVR